MTTETKELIDLIVAPSLGLSQTSKCKVCGGEVKRGEWISNGGECDACAKPLTVEKCEGCNKDLSEEESLDGIGLCRVCQDEFSKRSKEELEEMRHPDDGAI